MKRDLREILGAGYRGEERETVFPTRGKPGLRQILAAGYRRIRGAQNRFIKKG